MRAFCRGTTMLAQAATAIWLVVVELAFTGQRAALDAGTEAECHAALARIARGEFNAVIMDNGLRLPIARGLGCIPKTPATS